MGRFGNEAVVSEALPTEIISNPGFERQTFWKRTNFECVLGRGLCFENESGPGGLERKCKFLTCISIKEVLTLGTM